LLDIDVGSDHQQDAIRGMHGSDGPQRITRNRLPIPRSTRVADGDFGRFGGSDATSQQGLARVGASLRPPDHHDLQAPAIADADAMQPLRHQQPSPMETDSRGSGKRDISSTEPRISASPSQESQPPNAALNDQLDALIRQNKEKLAQLADDSTALPIDHPAEQSSILRADDGDSDVGLPLLWVQRERCSSSRRSLPAAPSMDHNDGTESAFLGAGGHTAASYAL